MIIGSLTDDSYSIIYKCFTRTDKQTKKEIEKQAKKQNISLNQYLFFMLEQAVGWDAEAQLNKFFSVELFSKILHEISLNLQILRFGDYLVLKNDCLYNQVNSAIVPKNFFSKQNGEYITKNYTHIEKYDKNGQLISIFINEFFCKYFRIKLTMEK